MLFAALLPIFSFLSGCLGPRPGPLLRIIRIAVQLSCVVESSRCALGIAALSGRALLARHAAQCVVHRRGDAKCKESFGACHVGGLVCHYPSLPKIRDSLHELSCFDFHF